jgi:hypothetical protein
MVYISNVWLRFCPNGVVVTNGTNKSTKLSEVATMHAEPSTINKFATHMGDKIKPQHTQLCRRKLEALSLRIDRIA